MGVDHSKSIGLTFFELITIIILVFQNSLQSIFSPFNYFDELISVCIFILYLMQVLKDKVIYKRDMLLLLLTVVCICIGFFGNYISKAQSSIFFQISDVVSTFRFLWLYIGLKTAYPVYLNKKINFKSIFAVLNVVFKTYTSLIFFFGTTNLFVNLNMSYEIRYGLRSFAFVFGTPGLVINQMSYLLIFFTAYKELMNKKSTNIFICMTLLTIAYTLRSRGIILVLIYLGLQFVIVITKGRHLKLKLVLGSSLIILAGLSQFQYYFLDSELTPRRRFVDGAFYLVNEYFPLGSGFATFGSSAAAQHYSNIYYQLGFSILRGMGPNNQLFLNDNYFPMIFGELGLMGGGVFIIILVVFVKDFFSQYFVKATDTSKIITTFIVLDLLMSSVQSSYLAHYSTVALIFIGLFCLNALSIEKDH